MAVPLPGTSESRMSTYKTTQRRLTLHGREFHFVSC